MAWGALPDNLAVGLRLPPPRTDQEMAPEWILAVEQLHALFGAAGSTRTETLLRAAGEAGLRRGELAGLKWVDVDFHARRLHVRRQVVQLRPNADTEMTKVEQPTKGRRSRKAAISQNLVRRLADWYAESVVEGGADALGYVWPGRDGGPMHDRSAYQALQRAATRAGLVDAKGKAAVSVHGLRHSAASAMLLAGVPLLVVSRQLGHATPQVTASVYAHLINDEALDLAADAFTMGEAMGGTAPPVQEPTSKGVLPNPGAAL